MDGFTGEAFMWSIAFGMAAFTLSQLAAFEGRSYRKTSIEGGLSS
jgi:hypothetical protein